MTASFTFNSPFCVVVFPIAPISTSPPPNVVFPVEVANILLASPYVSFVIAPPFNSRFLEKVLMPVTCKELSNIVNPVTRNVLARLVVPPIIKCPLIEAFPLIEVSPESLPIVNTRVI